MTSVTVSGGPSTLMAVAKTWNLVDLAVDSPFFTADRAYTVVSAIARVEVAGTDLSAVTAVVSKAASGTAIAAGTALHSGTINLKGTAATNQVLTLTNTTLASGDSLCFDLTGVATAAVGSVTVLLRPA